MIFRDNNKPKNQKQNIDAIFFRSNRRRPFAPCNNRPHSVQKLHYYLVVAQFIGVCVDFEASQWDIYL